MLKKVDETNPYSSEEDSVSIDGEDSIPASDRNWRSARAVGQGLFMIAVIAVAIVVMNKLIDSKPETKARPSFKSAYTVDLFTAAKADNRPSFISYGQIVAARTVDLRALVSGEVVAINSKLQPGQMIKKGDTLVEIDRFNYEGALQEANSNLLEAKSRVTENEARIALEQSKQSSLGNQLEFAKADLARMEKLRTRGQSTEQQREARQLVVSQREQAVALSRDTVKIEQARLDQLRASLQRLEWKVAQAQRNLESTKLVAPFTGIVRSASAEQGRLVSANDVVVALYEEGSLEAKFTLTDEQYGRLQTAGDGLLKRTVDVAWTVGGKSYIWPAKIDRLGADISSSRGGIEVFASVGTVENAVSLRPGAFVEVTVPDITFNDSFKIPDTALYGSNTVYISVDGKLQAREVEVAAFVDETVLIGSGLQEGDRVLTTRITEVSPGLAVRTEKEANAPEADKEASKGRPSSDELAAILKDNDLTAKAFRALSQDERRKLIRAHRTKSDS